MKKSIYEDAWLKRVKKNNDFLESLKYGTPMIFKTPETMPKDAIASFALPNMGYLYGQRFTFDRVIKNAARLDEAYLLKSVEGIERSWQISGEMVEIFILNED